MGTRGRITILHNKRTDIVFWIRFDAYVCGLGDKLCEIIKGLLERYSAEELQALIDKKTPDPEGTSCDYFDMEEFERFILETPTYHSADCDDIQYEYFISFRKAFISVYDKGRVGDLGLRLGFKDISDGRVLSEFEAKETDLEY